MSDLETKLILSGHQCRLFDDPEKFIESYEGRHLHPWNGDESLMIDRFDCRNFLTCLTKYDSIKNQDVIHDEKESEDQVLCEYERYLELLVDVQEEKIIAEEHEKRYNENINGYAAVKFSYDKFQDKSEPENVNDKDSKLDDKVVQEKTEDEADHTPYILPHDLVMPKEYALPKTERQAIVIEKTAAFIARQGVQMEIVLKTRQADNSQFAFLDHDNELNPFYKEMTRLIRIGMYIPRRFIPYLNNNNNTENKTFESDKSIMNGDSSVSIETKVPKVDISGTSYAALINRFKSKNFEAKKDEKANVGSTQDMSRPTSRSGECASQNDEKRWQEKYNQLYKHYYDYYQNHYLPAFNGERDSIELAEKVTHDAMTAAQAATLAIKRSETEPIESLKEDMTPDQCVIIEKMAEYVAKNGADFENVVYSQKGSNPQFAFLQPINKYHAYYLAKRRSFHITMSSSTKVISASPPPDTLNATVIDVKASTPPQSSVTLPVKKVDCISIKINNNNNNNYKPEKSPADKKKPTGLVAYDTDESDDGSDVELHPSLLGDTTSTTTTTNQSDESSKAKQQQHEIKESSPSSTLKMALLQVNQMSILHNASKENLLSKVKPPLTALITNPKLSLLKTTSSRLKKKSREKSPKESSRRHHKKSHVRHRSRTPKRRRSSPSSKRSSSSRRQKRSPTSSSHNRSKIYETKVPVTSSNESSSLLEDSGHRDIDEESLQRQLERKQKAAVFFARLKKESEKNSTEPLNDSPPIPGNVPAAVIALMQKTDDSDTRNNSLVYSAGSSILEIRNGDPPEAYSEEKSRNSSKKSSRKSSSSKKHRSHRSRSRR